jgi:hypothetical protein
VGVKVQAISEPALGGVVCFCERTRRAMPASERGKPLFGELGAKCSTAADGNASSLGREARMDVGGNRVRHMCPSIDAVEEFRNRLGYCHGRQPGGGRRRQRR